MEDSATRQERLYREVVRFIAQTYGDREVRLTDASRELAVSPRQVQRALHAVGDRSFSDLLDRYRMERARELLEADPSMAARQIAKHTGYGSGAALAKAFRRYWGRTIAEVRYQ